MKRIVQIAEQLLEEFREANREETAFLTLAKKPFVPQCLIVEDDQNDAELSTVALESIGAHVQVATTGDEAIKILDDSIDPGIPDFHIVFLDLQLQGSRMQGIDVLLHIRHRFPKLHVVLVSAYIDNDVLHMISTLNGGGYVGIVTKPLHKINVKEVLQKHRLFPDDPKGA